MAGLTATRLAALEAAAIAAPSADNRHVFRLSGDAKTLRLTAAPSLLEASSSRRVLGLISIGAVVENLILRAARLGLLLERREGSWWDDRPLLAEFTCHEAPAFADPLEAAIELRHTNRRLRFRGPPLSPSLLEELNSQAGTVPGTELVWLDHPGTRRRALRLIRKAEAERFRNQQLHQELFESIRFDVGWDKSAPEGLAPGALELTFLERLGFSALRHWQVQRLANFLGAHKLMGTRAAYLPCRFAPNLCAVVATGDLASAAVGSGRLMQRLWLAVTRAGLSAQVFAASPLFALEGATHVAPALQQSLAEGWNEICARERAFLVIRMGNAEGPSQRSGRVPPGQRTTQGKFC